MKQKIVRVSDKVDEQIKKDRQKRHFPEWKILSAIIEKYYNPKVKNILDLGEK